MSCYTPKRKTNNGIEEVKIPIKSVNGLEEKLKSMQSSNLNMPIIRLAAITDTDNTMVITRLNPLKFCIEIIDGNLQIGDEVQICARQLFTYDDRNKRKYKLRRQWGMKITDSNVHQRFIFIEIAEAMSDRYQRLFKTNDRGKTTLSPLYIRVRRPIYAGKSDVDGKFSNIITVWKKYDMSLGKIIIK